MTTGDIHLSLDTFTLLVNKYIKAPILGKCAQRAIAEAKQRSQWSVIRLVVKIYYLELIRALKGTLSRWSRLHLQSLAPTPVSRRVDVRQAAGR
jgi:hypothetical protein